MQKLKTRTLMRAREGSCEKPDEKSNLREEKPHARREAYACTDAKAPSFLASNFVQQLLVNATRYSWIVLWTFLDSGVRYGFALFFLLIALHPPPRDVVDFVMCFRDLVFDVVLA